MIEHGEYVLAGLTVVLADDEKGDAAFQRPLQFSTLALSSDASGVRVRAVMVDSESESEVAEVKEAEKWAVAFVMGEVPGIKIQGALAQMVERHRGRADTPAVVGAHGLRFENESIRGELRHLGNVWVLVERPTHASGTMVSLLAEKLALDPAPLTPGP
jgi:hypothetical protein